MRVDLATHVQFDSDAMVEHFIKCLKLQLAFCTKSFSAYGNDTVYIGQHSDNKTTKFYNKGRQLQAHPLHKDLPQKQFIEASSTGLLRTEVVWRRRFLKSRGIVNVCDWNPVNARIWLAVEVLALNLRNVKLKTYEYQPALSKMANTLLAVHMEGVDVETVITSSRALKGHAKAIVKETGTNIFIPFAAQAACIKTDLESLPERLTFGINADAAARGITTGLPKTEPDFLGMTTRAFLTMQSQALV